MTEGRNGRWTAVLGLVATSALALTAPAWAVGHASGTTCSFTDKASGAAYGSLSAAVNNAGPGGTVIVQGTCVGTSSLWSADVSIVGRGGATLDGGSQGTVLSLNNSNVTITNLTITGGAATNGGGIYSLGTLTLKGVTVTGNSATGYGGGIYSAGTLSLDHSKVSGNIAGTDGGGIYYTGTLNQGGGTKITGNQPNDIATTP